MHKNVLQFVSDGKLNFCFSISLMLHAESVVFSLRVLLHGIVAVMQAFVKWIGRCAQTVD